MKIPYQITLAVELQADVDDPAEVVREDAHQEIIERLTETIELIQTKYPDAGVKAVCHPMVFASGEFQI